MGRGYRDLGDLLLGKFAKLGRCWYVRDVCRGKRCVVVIWANCELVIDVELYIS
jgi:hypothetical protein